MIDNRTPEQQAADRAAMAILEPGMIVQHTLYPGHRSTVIRVYTDDAGDWLERSDGTARPRFFAPVDQPTPGGRRRR